MNFYFNLSIFDIRYILQMDVLKKKLTTLVMTLPNTTLQPLQKIVKYYANIMINANIGLMDTLLQMFGMQGIVS